MSDEMDRDLGQPASRRRRSAWTYKEGEGAAFDRVAYFTDAVFAIAMTLLIVSVELPEVAGPQDAPSSLLEPLADLGPQLFSFFLAFLLLGRYWMTHHAFFAVLQRVDRASISLNLVYLAFVAFLPFPTELVGKYEHNPVSFALFALTLAMISGMEAVIFRHAHRTGLLARPMPESTYRYGMIQSTTPVVLFVLSIPIAFLWSPTAALLSWILAAPIGMIVGRLRPVGDEDPNEAIAPPDE